MKSCVGLNVCDWDVLLHYVDLEIYACVQKLA